jgi:uncharacterized phage infection (PIP) family protein YhgE
LVQRQDETIGWLRKLDEGQHRLEDLHELQDGQRKLEQRQGRLEDGQLKLEDGQLKLEDGQRRLEDGQRRLEDGQLKLEGGLRHVEDGLHKLGDRHDILLGRIDQMEIRFELKFNKLEAFATDAQQRLKRIEAYLQPRVAIHSGQARPRRKAARYEPSKRGKKS